MAYGRFGGGGQSNLRSRRPKRKTLFGFTIGPPPKSDQEKKIEAGATRIATKDGKIVTTPTMDNKSRIMSKPEQSMMKTQYLSSTKNLADVKQSMQRSRKASENFTDFPVDTKPVKQRATGPVYKGQTINRYDRPKALTSKIVRRGSNKNFAFRGNVKKERLSLLSNKENNKLINQDISEVSLIPKLSTPKLGLVPDVTSLFGYLRNMYNKAKKRRENINKEISNRVKATLGQSMK